VAAQGGQAPVGVLLHGAGRAPQLSAANTVSRASKLVLLPGVASMHLCQRVGGPSG
jgi:hypothetical protein